VRRGDEDGWSRFYELYEEFVYSAARATGLSHEESRDVLQDTMVTVRDYISNFVADKTRAKFRTWLRKIVQSRIADQYRRKKRNPLEQAQRDALPDETATSTTNRIPNLNEVELDRLIDGKLEQAILTEARRLTKDKVRMEDYQAYDLFQIQNLGAREVGISLGISPVTVRVRALRVRRVIERQVRRLVKLLERPNCRDLR
jgi:RNA polymerase sigma factor (sigma-70 family)